MRRKRERARLRAKRHALRQRLRKRREAVTARRKPSKRRRWWPWVLVLLAIALLLCMGPCNADLVDDPPIVAEAATGPGAPMEPSPPPLEPLADGRVSRQHRPEYRSGPPPTLPWLPAFRMQVAARSPRLAECFVGAEQPGKLKWTAAVDPVEGRVADHILEPTVQNTELTSFQRGCVLQVLVQPPYRLEAGEDSPSTPSRVSIVIEF